MTERDLPQTEAGRRLLADSGPYVITGEHSLVERILAIEQEARADLAARIEKRLDGLVNEDWVDTRTAFNVIAAVRDAIREASE